MQGQVVRHRASSTRQNRTDALLYWLMFAVCFGVFLCTIVIERLLLRRRGRPPEGRRPLAIVVEARETAHRCATVAFQG